MQIHNLQRKHPLKKPRQVGRGGKRGKTAGRGTKGQRARAGRKMRPELRDIIKKLPKMRGYRFHSITAKPVPVNLAALEASFEAGAEVTPTTLVAKGLVRPVSGVSPVVKILGTGTLTKVLKISGCQVSATAKAVVEKAGGTIK